LKCNATFSDRSKAAAANDRYVACGLTGVLRVKTKWMHMKGYYVSRVGEVLN